jgi:hypothetical protein
LLIIAAYAAIFAIDGIPLLRKRDTKEIVIFAAVFLFSLVYTSMYALNKISWTPFESLMRVMLEHGIDFNQIY